MMEFCYQFSLEAVDTFIHPRTISIEVQPPKNLRYRYKSDGKRQIEKSRTKPMIIQLPDLKSCAIDSSDLFWIRLFLITHSENESDQVYFHPNVLEYHCDGVQALADKTVCVPLTETDICLGKKKLSRLSLIKTTLDHYKSNLVPFSLSKQDDELQLKTTNIMQAKITKREAKQLYRKFNLKASRIVCQLLLKKNEVWRYTDISCITDVIENKDPKNLSNKPSEKSKQNRRHRSSKTHWHSFKHRTSKRKQYRD